MTKYNWKLEEPDMIEMFNSAIMYYIITETEYGQVCLERTSGNYFVEDMEGWSAYLVDDKRERQDIFSIDFWEVEKTFVDPREVFDNDGVVLLAEKWLEGCSLSCLNLL